MTSSEPMVPHGHDDERDDGGPAGPEPETAPDDEPEQPSADAAFPPPMPG
jgi:hypothetical protein